MKTRYQDIKAFVTKDGSLIRELMHPTVHGNWAQSLAEATVPVGTRTTLHRHRESEELYHITAGKGLMSLNGERFEVTEGDTVCILPGLPHCIENTGAEALKILCCCAPAYSDEDTELLE
jgi:mannose-6-phosphate isomerase-like protein (cupin superfamily)